VFLYDQADTQIGTLRDLCARFGKEVAEAGCTPQQVKHTFDQPTFFQIPGSSVPRVKFISLSVTVEVQKTFKRFVAASNFVVLVLKSLDDGTLKRFWGPREALPKLEGGIQDS
jgi:hypothetical protein